MKITYFAISAFFEAPRGIVKIVESQKNIFFVILVGLNTSGEISSFLAQKNLKTDHPNVHTLSF